MSKQVQIKKRKSRRRHGGGGDDIPEEIAPNAKTIAKGAEIKTAISAAVDKLNKALAHNQATR